MTDEKKPEGDTRMLKPWQIGAALTAAAAAWLLYELIARSLT
jgi:hypothetical protein